MTTCVKIKRMPCNNRVAKACKMAKKENIMFFRPFLSALSRPSLWRLPSLPLSSSNASD